MSPTFQALFPELVLIAVACVLLLMGAARSAGVRKVVPVIALLWLWRLGLLGLAAVGSDGVPGADPGPRAGRRRRPRIGAGARQDGDPLMATPADHRIGRRAPGFPRRTGRDWAGTQDRPLRVCLAAMAAFGAYTAGWATAVRLRGRPLPDRPEPRDVLLNSMASTRTAGQLLWPRAPRAATGTRVAAGVRRAGRQDHRQRTADHRSYVKLLLQTRAKSRLSGDLVGTWLSPLRQGDHPHHPEERQWPCASE